MIKSTMYDRYDDFIKKYEELCIKTGITITYSKSNQCLVLDDFNTENLKQVKTAIRNGSHIMK